MTYGEQKISLSRKLGDPISTADADGGRFTNNMLGDWLNEATFEAARRATDEALWTLTTMVQGASLPPSTPLLRMLYVTFKNSSGTEKIASEVSPLRREDITNSNMAILGTSDEPKWYIEDGVIKFYPAVNDATYVRFYFIRVPPAMTVDTADCPLPQQFHYAVIHYAAFLGLTADGRAKEAGFYMEMFSQSMLTTRPFSRRIGVIKPLSLGEEPT